MVHANDVPKTIASCDAWIHIRTASDRREASGGPRRLQIGFGRHDQALRYPHSRLPHYERRRQTPNRRVDLRRRLSIRKVRGKMDYRSDHQEMKELDEKNRQNNKTTCRYLKDEPVNGEMAAVYSVHSVHE